MIFARKNEAVKAILISLIFWLVFIALLVISGMISNGFLPPNLSRFGYGMLGTITVMIATWLFLRLEKKSFQDIGLVWELKTLPRFFAGFIIGSAVFGTIILALIVFGKMQFAFNPQPFRLFMLIPYLVFIPLALMEEIAFRAFPFVKLDKAIGLLTTQVIVSIAFALYHIVNGWNIQEAFLGTLVWAWVFGLAAVWSGGIALPTGLHVAINVLQGLTGMKAGNSIWVVVFEDQSQQNILSGADRIGMIMQLVILMSAIGLTIFYNRRNSTVPGS